MQSLSTELQYSISICARTIAVVYGHTHQNAPYLVRTAKLSWCRPCQYYPRIGSLIRQNINRWLLLLHRCHHIVRIRGGSPRALRPSSPFFNGILGRALARLGDTGGRYCRLWHLRGNLSMSPLAAPMPPGLSWSTPTRLCTPEIAAPSPPGGRWLLIWLHAPMQPCSR